MLIGALMRFSPYSFSKMNLYEMCPKKFDYNYIQKLGIWVPNLATERGSYIHLLLENDTKGKPTTYKFTLIDDEIQQECIDIYENFKKTDLGEYYFSPPAEAEVDFGVKRTENGLEPCSYYDKEALFRGKIDHFINHENGLLTMADWKTGKVSAFPAPLQLAMYALWGFLKYPEVSYVETAFVYVEHQEAEKPYTFKREHLQALTKKVIEKIVEIEVSKEYPKKETVLCNYCEYRKSGLCEESSQDEFQDLMVGMIKPYKKKKRETLYYYIHPESDCAWIQDYPYDGQDGLVEEVDETFFYNLTDYGYDEKSIDKTIIRRDDGMV